MEEKLSREQYRVRTYGGPTGRATQSSIHPTASDSSAEPGLPISTSRAIIQFDADAFYGKRDTLVIREGLPIPIAYSPDKNDPFSDNCHCVTAQVEEGRNPRLKGVPLGERAGSCSLYWSSW